MNSFYIFLIRIIHILYLSFVIFTPFSNNKYLKFIYLFIIPFMMIHWKLNNDTCFLTIIEQYFTNSNEGFIARIISPIYKFPHNNNSLSILIYIITIMLWTYCLYTYIDDICKTKKNHLTFIDMIS